MIEKIMDVVKKFRFAVDDFVTAVKLSAIRQELDEAHELYDRLTARQAAGLISEEEKAERALAAWKIYKIGCHRFGRYKIFFNDRAGRSLGRYRGEILDVKARKGWFMISGDDNQEAMIPFRDDMFVSVCEGNDSLIFTLASP